MGLPLLCPFYLFCFDCSGCTTSSATDHRREIPPFLLDHDHAFGTFSKYCIYPHSIWGSISLHGIPECPYNWPNAFHRSPQLAMTCTSLLFGRSAGAFSLKRHH